MLPKNWGDVIINSKLPGKNSGFTIVELLIVIVVIAILATISIVAYNGIQQRANNTKTIAAVNQVIRVVSGYIATNGSYPSTGNYCLVAKESSCLSYGVTRATNATLTSNLQTIGSLPSSLSEAHADWVGITYNYSPTATFNGTTQPARIGYSLQGEWQQCGVANVADSGGTVMEASSTGWTTVNGGHTICVVSISGPSS